MLNSGVSGRFPPLFLFCSLPFPSCAGARARLASWVLRFFSLRVEILSDFILPATARHRDDQAGRKNASGFGRHHDAPEEEGEEGEEEVDMLVYQKTKPATVASKSPNPGPPRLRSLLFAYLPGGFFFHIWPACRVAIRTYGQRTYSSASFLQRPRRLGGRALFGAEPVTTLTTRLDLTFFFRRIVPTRANPSPSPERATGHCEFRWSLEARGRWQRQDTSIVRVAGASDSFHVHTRPSPRIILRPGTVVREDRRAFSSEEARGLWAVHGKQDRPLPPPSHPPLPARFGAAVLPGSPRTRKHDDRLRRQRTTQEHDDEIIEAPQDLLLHPSWRPTRLVTSPYPGTADEADLLRATKSLLAFSCHSHLPVYFSPMLLAVFFFLTVAIACT
nr:hypothetical protein CFP56_03102 [Quercus suber]